MSQVRKVELPPGSLLQERILPGDFVDCYAVDSNLSPRAAAEIVTAFPGWARGLLALRNLLVAPFGLSTEGPAAVDNVGIFPVEIATEQELIAGFNDKHLEFRVAVLALDQQIHLATWVHPHNLWGRVYLGTIMPFHVAIVRNALKRVAQQG